MTSQSSISPCWAWVRQSSLSRKFRPREHFGVSLFEGRKSAVVTTSLNSNKGNLSKAREELVCMKFSWATLSALWVWAAEVKGLPDNGHLKPCINTYSHGCLRWHHGINIDKSVQYLEPMEEDCAEIMEKNKRSLILICWTHTHVTKAANLKPKQTYSEYKE